MKNDSVIEVNKVAKKFCKSLGKSLKYGLVDISRGVLGLSNKPDKLRPYEFWAIEDTTFAIKEGETLGIIGANGSGKSTLLKLLNGIFLPDKGEIKIRGRVGALISVGAGFHPMLTGRENIYVNGAILEISKKEMDKRFDQIVEFADIGDFLDTPVKNYSSGMYVRLGFSIAIHCLPDILLVDEVLSIGDVNFQQKSLQKMREIVKSGRVVIFVSHSMETMLSFTKKAIYLKNGRIKGMGNTERVIKEYLDDLKKEGRV